MEFDGYRGKKGDKRQCKENSFFWKQCDYGMGLKYNQSIPFCLKKKLKNFF